MANRRRESPSELTPSWPDAPSSDPAGETARQFVLNLRCGLGERSVRAVAEQAGLDEATVRRVLSGAAWPDLRTVARLEDALGARLYPR
ncbi:helix-turn-helix domain-containing protein [Microbacterium wangruii]|uniref:helix-turn-helix domain-containing protein n=1 Tax=Microbacterium wangruii TaxID=3049073 RepID=UPI0035AFE4EC